MKCSMIKLALAASVAIGASALMAQEMGAANEEPQTVTEQIDPDKGPQIVQEAEAKQPEVKAEKEAQAESEKFIPAGEAVRTMLKKQLKLKEGYDRKKKAIIVIGEAAKKISEEVMVVPGRGDDDQVLFLARRRSGRSRQWIRRRRPATDAGRRRMRAERRHLPLLPEGGVAGRHQQAHHQGLRGVALSALLGHALLAWRVECA